MWTLGVAENIEEEFWTPHKEKKVGSPNMHILKLPGTPSMEPVPYPYMKIGFYVLSAKFKNLLQRIWILEWAKWLR